MLGDLIYLIALHVGIVKLLEKQGGLWFYF
jgi:hypothetical protein